MTFDYFDVEGDSNSDDCPYDYLEIYSQDEFGQTNVNDARKLCGENSDPGMFLS